MRKLIALTLCTLLTTTCYPRGQKAPLDKGSTMTFGVGTQAELDQANERINAFHQALLKQGFREVSVSSSNSAEEFVLEGQHGRLNNLRVTLKTNKRLEEDKPEVAGGIHASIPNEQADKEFEELYAKVVAVVTGRPQ